VGVRTLQLGRPLSVLGEAIYKVPGLSDLRPLDEFWRDPAPPDTALRDAFMAAIAATIQVRGVYYARPGLDAAVAESVERLDQGLINEMLPEPAAEAPGA
jgi:capsular polysaccharide export protein